MRSQTQPIFKQRYRRREGGRAGALRGPHSRVEEKIPRNNSTRIDNNSVENSKLLQQTLPTCGENRRGVTRWHDEDDGGSLELRRLVCWSTEEPFRGQGRVARMSTFNHKRSFRPVITSFSSRRQRRTDGRSGRQAKATAAAGREGPGRRTQHADQVQLVN